MEGTLVGWDIQLEGGRALGLEGGRVLLGMGKPLEVGAGRQLLLLVNLNHPAPDNLCLE